MLKGGQAQQETVTANLGFVFEAFALGLLSCALNFLLPLPLGHGKYNKNKAKTMLKCTGGCACRCPEGMLEVRCRQYLIWFTRQPA